MISPQPYVQSHSRGDGTSKQPSMSQSRRGSSSDVHVDPKVSALLRSGFGGGVGVDGRPILRAPQSSRHGNDRGGDGRSRHAAQARRSARGSSGQGGGGFGRSRSEVTSDRYRPRFGPPPENFDSLLKGSLMRSGPTPGADGGMGGRPSRPTAGADDDDDDDTDGGRPSPAPRGPPPRRRARSTNLATGRHVPSRAGPPGPPPSISRVVPPAPPPPAAAGDGGLTRMNIIAPAGKLCLVVDSPPDDVSTPAFVCKIKKDCPIKGTIKLGDRIIAVDDEDVSTLTAIQVSMLLGSKSRNDRRKITVLRDLGGDETDDGSFKNAAGISGEDRGRGRAAGSSENSGSVHPPPASFAPRGGGPGRAGPPSTGRPGRPRSRSVETSRTRSPSGGSRCSNGRTSRSPRREQEAAGAAAAHPDDGDKMQGSGRGRSRVRPPSPPPEARSSDEQAQGEGEVRGENQGKEGVDTNQAHLVMDTRVDSICSQIYNYLDVLDTKTSQGVREKIVTHERDDDAVSASATMDPPGSLGPGKSPHEEGQLRNFGHSTSQKLSDSDSNRLPGVNQGFSKDMFQSQSRARGRRAASAVTSNRYGPKPALRNGAPKFEESTSSPPKRPAARGRTARGRRAASEVVTNRYGSEPLLPPSTWSLFDLESLHSSTPDQPTPRGKRSSSAAASANRYGPRPSSNSSSPLTNGNTEGLKPSFSERPTARGRGASSERAATNRSSSPPSFPPNTRRMEGTSLSFPSRPNARGKRAASEVVVSDRYAPKSSQPPSSSSNESRSRGLKSSDNMKLDRSKSPLSELARGRRSTSVSVVTSRYEISLSAPQSSPSPPSSNRNMERQNPSSSDHRSARGRRAASEVVVNSRYAPKSSKPPPSSSSKWRQLELFPPEQPPTRGRRAASEVVVNRYGPKSALPLPPPPNNSKPDRFTPPSSGRPSARGRRSSSVAGPSTRYAPNGPRNLSSHPPPSSNNGNAERQNPSSSRHPPARSRRAASEVASNNRYASKSSQPSSSLSNNSEWKRLDLFSSSQPVPRGGRASSAVVLTNRYAPPNAPPKPSLSPSSPSNKKVERFTSPLSRHPAARGRRSSSVAGPMTRHTSTLSTPPPSPSNNSDTTEGSDSSLSDGPTVMGEKAAPVVASTNKYSLPDLSQPSASSLNKSKLSRLKTSFSKQPARKGRRSSSLGVVESRYAPKSQSVENSSPHAQAKKLSTKITTQTRLSRGKDSERGNLKSAEVASSIRPPLKHKKSHTSSRSRSPTPLEKKLTKKSSSPQTKNTEAGIVEGLYPSHSPMDFSWSYIMPGEPDNGTGGNHDEVSQMTEDFASGKLTSPDQGHSSINSRRLSGTEMTSSFQERMKQDMDSSYTSSTGRMGNLTDLKIPPHKGTSVLTNESSAVPEMQPLPDSEEGNKKGKGKKGRFSRLKSTLSKKTSKAMGKSKKNSDFESVAERQP